VYRLRKNRCGSHAKLGTLRQNFVEMGFRTKSGRRFRKGFDGQTAAPEQEQFTQGVR
jgi:hypothetical protein